MSVIDENLPALKLEKVWTSKPCFEKENAKSAGPNGYSEKANKKFAPKKPELPKLILQFTRENKGYKKSAAGDRVLEQLATYRNDPEAYDELCLRVKKNLRLKSKTGRERRSRLQLTESSKTARERFCRLYDRRSEVARRKKVIDNCRQKRYLKTLTLRNDLRERQKEHASKIVTGTSLLTIVLAQTMIKKIFFIRKRVEKETKNDSLKSEFIKKIQKNWRKKRVVKAGRHYRHAVYLIRSFVQICKSNMIHKRVRRKANLIRWVFLEMETSNFQKVVKNYRDKVVKCQRLYRDFKTVSEMRLQVLTKKLQLIELQTIEKKAMTQQVQKLKREMTCLVDLFGSEMLHSTIMFLLTSPTIRVETKLKSTNLSLRIAQLHKIYLSVMSSAKTKNGTGKRSNDKGHFGLNLVMKVLLKGVRGFLIEKMLISGELPLPKEILKNIATKLIFEKRIQLKMDLESSLKSCGNKLTEIILDEKDVDKFIASRSSVQQKGILRNVLKIQGKDESRKQPVYSIPLLKLFQNSDELLACIEQERSQI